jgi:hypothetical protein
VRRFVHHRRIFSARAAAPTLAGMGRVLDARLVFVVPAVAGKKTRLDQWRPTDGEVGAAVLEGTVRCRLGGRPGSEVMLGAHHGAGRRSSSRSSGLGNDGATPAASAAGRGLHRTTSDANARETTARHAGISQKPAQNQLSLAEASYSYRAL